MGKKNINLYNIHGFINLNKAAGLSSHSAIGAVRRLLSVKVGHAGTLDPAACGVLPVCLGNATRLAEYLQEGTKKYIGRISLGAVTDSYDADGTVLERSDASHITKEDVLAVLPHYLGNIMQVPPMISALKFQGQPLYKLAREGQELELSPRPVCIYDLKFLEGCFGVEEPYFSIEVSCSKGTYIRSLAFDIGQELGCGAHLSGLCRTKSGFFEIDNSFTIEELENKFNSGDMSFVLPMSYPLQHLPVLEAKEEWYKRLLFGNEIFLDGEYEEAEVLRVEDSSGELLGIGSLLKNDPENEDIFVLKLKKVFAKQ